MHFYIPKFLTVMACSILLAACGSSSSSKHAFDSSVSTDGPTTTTSTITTTSGDPYAILATIDAEYVRKVLQRIEAVHGEVRRDVFATHQFTDDDRHKIESIYADHYLNVALSEWPTLASTDHPDIKPNPADAVVSIQQVLIATPTCISVYAKFDEAANLQAPESPQQAHVILIKRSHNTLINPTPWLAQQETIPGQLKKGLACD